MEGSVNLPINQIPTIDISKDTPIFVYCLSGARSKRAEKFLQKMDIRQRILAGLPDIKESWLYRSGGEPVTFG